MKLWRTPLDAGKVKQPEGTVNVIIERCKGCGFCIEYCPRDVLVLSENFNRKGYHYPNILKEGFCVNCNLCSNICPEFAIYSDEMPDDIPESQDKEGCCVKEK